MICTSRDNWVPTSCLPVVENLVYNMSFINSLDDCDYLIEDGIRCTEFRNKYREKLDLIDSQIKSLSNLVIDLEKVLRIEGIFKIYLPYYSTNTAMPV